MLAVVEDAGSDTFAAGERGLFHSPRMRETDLITRLTG